jgi:hypothetical protein
MSESLVLAQTVRPVCVAHRQAIVLRRRPTYAQSASGSKAAGCTKHEAGALRCGQIRRMDSQPPRVRIRKRRKIGVRRRDARYWRNMAIRLVVLVVLAWGTLWLLDDLATPNPTPAPAVAE